MARKMAEQTSSHPPFNDLVVLVVKRLQGRLGVSQQEILKHINSNYEVKQGFAMMVKQALKRCVNKKILVQVKGGARGSFKVNKKIRRFSQYVTNVEAGVSGTLCGAGDKRVKKKQIHTTSDFNDENTSAEHQRDQGLLDKEKATKKKRSLTVKEKQTTLKDCSDNEEEEEEKEEEKLCEYEKQRLKRIKENQAFLASLNLTAAKEEMKALTNKQVKKNPYEKTNLADLEPSRHSLRIRKLQPNGLPLPPTPSPEIKSFRLPDIDLSMECVCEDHTKHSVPEIAFRKELVESYKSNTDLFNKHKQSLPASSRLHSFQKLKLTHIQPVTFRRPTAFAFHPATKKSLVVVGNKEGLLAMWDISKGCAGVYTYQPHVCAITDLAMSSSETLPSSHLLSASADGTLRSIDFERGVLDLCYSTPDGNKIGLTSCDISSKSGQVFTGQTNGVLVQLDRRMKKNIVASVQAHKKGIKSVHINPVHDHLLLTSSADFSVKLWDVRNLSYQLICLPFTGCVFSAYFSPVHGSKILVSTMKDPISIYHEVFSEEGKLCGTLPGKTVQHKNHHGVHQFRAQWDPCSDDCFIVGSGDTPRQVKIFSTGDYVIGLQDEKLTSVCPLNAIHSSKLIVGSVNLSGNVHIWM